MMRRTLALAAGATLVALGACGDDDDEASTEEYCEVVREFSAEDVQPTDELLDRYVEVAPDEIVDEARLAAEAIKEDGEAAFADPDVVDAVEDIEAFEESECGVGGDDDADGGDAEDDADTEDEEAPADTTEDTTDDTTDGGSTSSTAGSMTSTSAP